MSGSGVQYKHAVIACTHKHSAHENTSQLHKIMQLCTERTNTELVAGQFQLRDRAAHVYAEKQRVPDFKDVCNSEASLDEKLAKLGQLMDDSHASCRCSGISSHPPHPHRNLWNALFRGTFGGGMMQAVLEHTVPKKTLEGCSH